MYFSPSCVIPPLFKSVVVIVNDWFEEGRGRSCNREKVTIAEEEGPPLHDSLVAVPAVGATILNIVVLVVMLVLLSTSRVVFVLVGKVV